MRLQWNHKKDAPDNQETPKERRRLSEEHGAVYQAFVERQLANERERFDGLDSKGAALISTSGTLVTLVLAVGALATNKSDFQPTAAFVILAIAALALFVLASIAGLLSNQTRQYKVPSAATLDKIRRERRYWKRAEPAARNSVMKYDINTIRTLREVNNRKAIWIAGGRVLQILATVALAAVAIVGLLS